MNAEMKHKLEECFSPGRNQADCYGALPYIKENLERTEFNNDSDMRDMTDIILRSLKLDENNIKMAMSFYTAAAAQGNKNAIAEMNRLNGLLVMKNCFAVPRNEDGGLYI